MKRLNCVVIAMLMFFVLAGTERRSACAGENADTTISEVLAFDPGDTEVKGLSALTRTDDGVSMTLMTSDLEPGVYSVWWVIFNDEATPFSLGFATSHVVGPKGETTFAASLREGDPLSIRGSLADAREDEIHLVVRYHGPVDPQRLKEQLSSFEPDDAVSQQFSVQEAP